MASLGRRGFAFLALTSLFCVAKAELTLKTSNKGAPWFCHGLDCPKFKVLETTDAYELRKYEEGVWARVTIESYAYALAAPMGFRKLFKYIDGANEEGIKIPMTSPVLVEVEPSCGPFCKNNFTISFFVPFDFQKSPPRPSDSDISIDCSPAFKAYVAQSSGFTIDDFSLARMAKALTDALDAEGIKYDDDTFFFAGYDPPFRLKNRHNEVWVVAKEDDIVVAEA